NSTLGAYYNVSSKSTLGLEIGYHHNPFSVVIFNQANIKAASGQLEQTVESVSSGDRSWRNINVNLNYRHGFRRDHQFLTFSADAVKYRATSDQSLYSKMHNKVENDSSASLLLSNLPAEFTIYAMKADYSQKLQSNINLDAGFKLSQVMAYNDAYFYDVIGQTKSP